MVGSGRRESRKHGVWHGLCGMRIVLVRSYHEKSVPLSMPHVNGNVRQTHSLPHPVQRGTPTHPLRDNKRGRPKLSRSDFVQLPNIGKKPKLPIGYARAPRC